MKKFLDKTRKLAEQINPILAEFNKNGTLPNWPNYAATSKFESVKRAIRRGNLDLSTGIPFPVKPFNNRKPTEGRGFNEMKKAIYEQLKKRKSSEV